jgi:hypothetical protein
MWLRQFVVASVLACSLATSAQADQRAWFLSANSLTEVAVTIGGREWTTRDHIVLPPHEPISPILWAGGRYVVWFAARPEGHWFVRFDTRLRQLSAFPIDFVPSSMAIDRSAARLVVLASAAIYLVDVDRLSVVGQTAMPPLLPTESRSLAVARGRIFVGRSTADGSVTEVVVLNSSSLAQLRTIPGVWYAQASRDETRVYLQTRWPAEVQVWEPGALTLIHTGTVENFVHPVGDRIASEYRVPGLFSTQISVHEYERDSLDVRLHANIDVYSRPASGDFVLELQQASPRSPIVLRSQTNEYGVNFRVIHVFDPATLAHVREMREATFDTLRSNLLMLAPPDPLASFHVVVNARTAALTWPPLPDIGEYEVVVGSAPGLSDVGRFSTGGVPRALFQDIPAGTFYVRVRAINELGSSESAERPVYVPN